MLAGGAKRNYMHVDGAHKRHACCQCNKIQLQKYVRVDLAAPQRTCAFPAATQAAQEHTLPCSIALT